MKKIYETRLVSMMDPELKDNEIKIPENVLKIFTPNAIGRLAPIYKNGVGFKIIPITGNTVYASLDICRALLLDFDMDVIILSKFADGACRICMKICDATEDKSLKENTIAIPKVILEQDFKPDYITTFPAFDGLIEYNSVNIETTNSNTAKVSTDIMNKIDLIHNLQLCFWIKEGK